MNDPDADEDLIPTDVRRPRKLMDSRIQADAEMSDSDDEGEGGRRDHASHRELPEKATFRMGVADLAAGPSGHTTVARVLSQMEESEPMSLSPSPKPEGSNSRGSSNSDMDIED